jgi:MoxR-like ATPase
MTTSSSTVAAEQSTDFAPPAILPTPARLAALIAGLEAGLLERDAAVRLCLLAALAGEHVLLIGPPGSAKSELARRLHRAFAEARYFERLLTRFSTPEELFGPLSLTALEHDRYERLTDGYLPTAGIAFLDEVFKANSAILNALLTLLNEREFDNGSERRPVPLVSVIGASNEVPSDEALVAFYDRFLVRVAVVGVSDAAFTALLALPNNAAAPPAAALTAAERAAVLAARETITLSESAVAALQSLRAWLTAQTVAAPSDRRWRQLVGLMRVAALTEGRREVDELDLWLVPFVVAPEPANATALQAWFIAEVAQAAPLDAGWLTRAVEAFERQLDIEQRLPADDGSGEGAGKIALARSLGAQDSDADTLGSMRIVAAALEVRQRRHFNPLHVATRVQQVRALHARAHTVREALQTRHATLQQRLSARLWWPPSLLQRVLGGPAASLALLDGLLARLEAAQTGFASLPVNAHLPALEPAAIEPLE